MDSNRKRKLENANLDFIKSEWFQLPSRLLVDSPLRKLKRRMMNRTNESNQVTRPTVNFSDAGNLCFMCSYTKKKSFAESRKEAAELRKHILTLIKSDEIASPHEVIPNDEECNLIRYYYYIHQGVDIGNIAPLEKSWMEAILSRVPGRMRCQKETMRGLIKEINVR